MGFGVEVGLLSRLIMTFAIIIDARLVSSRLTHILQLRRSLISGICLGDLLCVFELFEVVLQRHLITHSIIKIAVLNQHGRVITPPQLRLRLKLWLTLRLILQINRSRHHLCILIRRISLRFIHFSQARCELSSNFSM